jgi:hypothetical protein
MKKLINSLRPTIAKLFVFVAILLCVCITLPTPALAQKTYRDASSGFLNETTFVVSAAYTANISTVAPVDIGAYASGVIVLNVTAVSGTSPSMTVNFQTCSSTPGSSTAPANAACTNHTASSAITATGVYIIKVDHFARWNTVAATITGTSPSFTFTAIGYFKPTS